MKFRKLGQVLLAAVVSTGFSLGITSCSNDHTVGYVYVLGTEYNQVGGYKEDNNNGILRSISGEPWGSGGTDPVRAIIPSGGRFLYVLNAGAKTEDSSGNISYSGDNISVFSIGGYGQLSFQHSYTSQGLGPIRIAADSGGSHLFVLDKYSPIGNSTGTVQTVSSTQTTDFPCEESSGVYRAVGDITVFDIDTSTGRLSLVSNSQQQNLTYFPVGCSPTDFRVTTSYIYTMDAGASSNNDVQTAYVYALASSTGQLTQTQNTPLPIGDSTSTIVSIGGNSSNSYLYFIDNGDNYIRPYTIGTSGALVSITSGATENTSSSVGNPQQLISVTGSSNSFVYVINAGPGNSTTTGVSDVSGYVVNSSNGHLDNPSDLSPYSLGTVSGAVCIFEDPSSQYIYVAGSNDNSIVGRKFDPQTGSLTQLNKSTAFSVVGTPSWCLSTSAQ